jgi:hypothetical protein
MTSLAGRNSCKFEESQRSGESAMNPVRRISDELRQMRWAQVVIELLLLVVGILIALAVDDWVQSRRDARSERQYLQLLVRDLERDDEIIREFITFEDRQVADGVTAYRALRGAADIEDKEAVAGSMSRLMSRRTLRLVRATYSDMVSTGNLRLIGNNALRDRIITYYETSDRRTAIVDRNNQFFVDQVYAAHLLDTGLIAPRPNNNLPGISAAMEALAARIAMPVDARGDRLWLLPVDAPERQVLLGKLWQRTAVSSQAIVNVRVIATQAAEARAAIAAEIGRRWSD